MHTQCTNNKMEFKPLTGQRVEGRFNAGQITSDAGGLLLGEVAGKMSFFDRAWRGVLLITGTPNELNTASKRCWSSAGTDGIALVRNAG
ncbi:MAG: hypothetical protein BRD45_03420 [Bacteroidetes bacterium QS_8_64_10]|nr:MAG: hypothetical protein BRD45_03420 [Bacteroidetes bacterium QS_8_64_10]